MEAKETLQESSPYISVGSKSRYLSPENLDLIILKTTRHGTLLLVVFASASVNEIILECLV